MLSDPRPIVHGVAFGVSAEMRYNLSGESDSATFTVLQYDAAGAEVGLTEVVVRAGESRWNWRRKGLFVWTQPDAVSIRVRFGLATAAESYLDIDHVR